MMGCMWWIYKPYYAFNMHWLYFQKLLFSYIQVLDNLFWLSLIIIVRWFNYSSEECNCCLCITSCPVTDKEELGYCMVKLNTLFFWTIISIWFNFNNENMICCWWCSFICVNLGETIDHLCHVWYHREAWVIQVHT